MERRMIFSFVLVFAMATPVLSQTVTAHPWQGKRVAYFGDSITDPNNDGSKMKWWQFLQQWLGIEPYVYAVSGKEWNDIPHQADQLIKEHGQAFDAILVFIGTNDYNHGVPVGQWWVETEDSVFAAQGKKPATVLRRHRTPSFDQGTYRGRINHALSTLKHLFPDKQIVLMTPIHRAYFYAGDWNVQPDEQYQNDCHEWLDPYIESVKQAGNIWAMPVIDMHAVSGLFPLEPAQSQYFHNEKDLLHPNDKGHERMARTVMYQLSVLPCTFE